MNFLREFETLWSMYWKYEVRESDNSYGAASGSLDDWKFFNVPDSLCYTKHIFIYSCSRQNSKSLTNEGDFPTT